MKKMILILTMMWMCLAPVCTYAQMGKALNAVRKAAFNKNLQRAAAAAMVTRGAMAAEQVSRQPIQANTCTQDSTALTREAQPQKASAMVTKTTPHPKEKGLKKYEIIRYTALAVILLMFAVFAVINIFRSRHTVDNKNYCDFGSIPWTPPVKERSSVWYVNTAGEVRFSL